MEKGLPKCQKGPNVGLSPNFGQGPNVELVSNVLQGM